MKSIYQYLLLLLILCFRAEFCSAEPDSLAFYHQQLSKTGEDSNRVNILFNITNYHLLRNRDSVSIYVRKVSEVAQKINWTKGMGDAEYLLARYYFLSRNFVSTLSSLDKALSYYSIARHPLGIARVFLQQSMVFWNKKDYVNGLKSVESGLKVLENNNLQPYTTLVFLRGVFLTELKKPAQGLPYILSASEIWKTENNSYAYSDAQIYLGYVLGLIGDSLQSEKAFHIADSINMELDHISGLFESYKKQAILLMQKKEYSAAEEMLWRINRDSSKFTEDFLEKYMLLSKVHAATGNFQQAYNDLRRYLFISDTYNINDINSQIASLQNRSEFLLKQSEIEILAQKRKNERLMIYGLSIVLLLVFISILIAYKRYTFKRDANRKLAKANQELMQTLEDLQLKEQQLLQAEKLASLGRITAGIAHELRNPLNFIENFAAAASETAEEYLKASPAQREVLASDLITSITKIREHGHKAEQIITTMLRHGKEKILGNDDVSLTELLNESISIATKNFGFKHEGFHCSVHLEDPASEIRMHVNAKSIPLVIGNLIDNAMYSVMQKSKVTGSSYQPKIVLRNQLSDKGLLLEIEDNGQGLPQENENEIFEPFFTTKPTGHGTGLGLSICYEILKAHGASITVKNNISGGATFNILFPPALLIQPENNIYETH